MLELLRNFLSGKRVIIPEENAADLREIPSQITHALEIIPVRWVDEVIAQALISEPKPARKKRATKNISKTKSTSSRNSSSKPH